LAIGSGGPPKAQGQKSSTLLIRRKIVQAGGKTAGKNLSEAATRGTTARRPCVGGTERGFAGEGNFPVGSWGGNKPKGACLAWRRGQAGDRKGGVCWKPKLGGHFYVKNFARWALGRDAGKTWFFIMVFGVGGGWTEKPHGREGATEGKRGFEDFYKLYAGRQPTGEPVVVG